jgi:hypothetical protein
VLAFAEEDFSTKINGSGYFYFLAFAGSVQCAEYQNGHSLLGHLDKHLIIRWVKDI